MEGQTAESSSPVDKMLHRPRERVAVAGTAGNPGWRWLFLSLWILLAIGITSICCFPTERPVLAIPLQLKGAVLVSPPGQNERSALLRHQPIGVGCQLQVPAGGSVVLSLLPGITVQAENAAEFALDTLTVNKVETTVESRRAGIILRAGTVRCAVVMPDDRQSELRVMTPAGIVRCGPGSVFSVAVSAENVRVVCGWGAVSWGKGRDHGGATVLLAGEYDDYLTDHPRATGDDAATQEEAVELLQAATLMNTLQDLYRLEQPFLLPPPH